MADLRQVAEQALREYDIAPRRITRAAESFNTVFRVTTATRSYALRVGATLPIHTGGTLQAESDWLHRLSEDRLTVPTVLANRAGDVGTEVLDSGFRSRTCAVFDWVAGRSLRGRLTASTAAALGRLAARLHIDAASWSPAHPPDVLVATEVLYWRLPARVATKNLPGSSIFSDALDRAQALLAELWRTPPHHPHLLHGDLTPANVIVSGGELVPIDFQDMVWGFDIQDLSISIAALRRFAGWPRLVEGFRHGYESLRAWPGVDPALFEALIAARTLNQINLTMNLHDPAGQTEYLSAQAERLSEWLKSGRMPS